MYLADAIGSNHRGPCRRCPGGLLHVLLPEVRAARVANGCATPNDALTRCDQCDYADDQEQQDDFMRQEQETHADHR